MIVDSTLWNTSAVAAPGSLRWQSPELLDGRQLTVTSQSDTYALAMTFYVSWLAVLPLWAVLTKDSRRSIQESRPFININFLAWFGKLLYKMANFLIDLHFLTLSVKIYGSYGRSVGIGMQAIDQQSHGF
jgi:hypothetical protein